MSARSRVDIIEPSSTSTRASAPIGLTPLAPRWPGKCPRCWDELRLFGTPAAARLLVAACEVATPKTCPRPAAFQIRLPTPPVVVLPVPPGPPLPARLRPLGSEA